MVSVLRLYKADGNPGQRMRVQIWVVSQLFIVGVIVNYF